MKSLLLLGSYLMALNPLYAGTSSAGSTDVAYAEKVILDCGLGTANLSLPEWVEEQMGGVDYHRLQLIKQTGDHFQGYNPVVRLFGTTTFAERHAIKDTFQIVDQRSKQPVDLNTWPIDATMRVGLRGDYDGSLRVQRDLRSHSPRFIGTVQLRRYDYAKVDLVDCKTPEG